MSKNHDKLRLARLEKGLTLQELSEEVGVTRQALSAYERGEYPPMPEVWEKLKKALDLKHTPKYYWGRVGKMGKPRMYKEGDVCYIEGCTNAPVCKGLCRKHYQRVRYHRIEYGFVPKIVEA